MVATKANAAVVEVEIDGPRNEHLYFRPLGKRIRGRFDLTRVSEPLAAMKRTQWPVPIPGQRVCIDLSTGEAWLHDGIHDDLSVLALVARTGRQPPPARIELGKIDVTTFVHWLHRAVEAGVGHVVAGELPAVDELEGEPRTEFLITRAPSTTDRLAAAIEAQTAMMARLLDRLTP